MNRSFVCKAVLVGLAAVGLSLLFSVGLGVFPASGSVVAAPLQEPTPTTEPAPVLTIEWKGRPALVDDLDGDGVIDPGDTIRYTFVYSNTGTADATLVTIEDDYDETFIVSIPDISDEGKDDGYTITWEFERVEEGKSDTVTYEATLRDAFPPGPSSLEDTATIRSAELADVSVTNAILVEVAAPILAIDLREAPALVEDRDDDGVIDPGDTIRYTLEYKNSGDAEATQVTIIDDYDESLIANIPSFSDKGQDVDYTVRWDFPVVEVGVTGWVTYEATLKEKFPPGSTDLQDTATIESGQLPRIDVTNAVLVRVPNFSAETETELVGDVDGDGNFDPGDTIKCIISYMNVGEAPATEARIVDDYAQDFFASIGNISGEGSCDGDTITWDLGTVEAGASGSVTYEGTLGDLSDGSHTVPNEATISSAEMEPVTSEASFLVVVLPPVPPPDDDTGFFLKEEAWKVVFVSLFLGALAMGAMAVLLYVGAVAEYSADDEGDSKRELSRERIELVRVGVFVIFIVSGVYVLALAGTVKGEAAISILSAIIGYIFGRATRRA